MMLLYTNNIILMPYKELYLYSENTLICNHIKDEKDG